MYQKKEFVKVILLSLVTCGIYGIIFLYEYDKELRFMLNSTAKRPMEFLLAFVLSILTCGLFIYYWYYTVFAAEAEEARSCGAVFAIEDPIVMTICMIIPFFGTYLLCDNFNKLADAKNAE